MFDKEIQERINDLESKGYYWSLGTHHEWKFDLRIYKKYNGKTKNFKLFISNKSLVDCFVKLEQYNYE